MRRLQLNCLTDITDAKWQWSYEINVIWAKIEHSIECIKKTDTFPDGYR